MLHTGPFCILSITLWQFSWSCILYLSDISDQCTRNHVVVFSTPLLLPWWALQNAQTHVQKHRSQRCMKITRQTSLSIIITFNLVPARLWCSSVCGRKFCLWVALSVSFFHTSKWRSDGMAPSSHRAAAAAVVCQCSCLLFSRSPGVWPDFSVQSRFYVSRNIILFPVLHTHTPLGNSHRGEWSITHSHIRYSTTLCQCHIVNGWVWVCGCVGLCVHVNKWWSRVAGEDTLWKQKGTDLRIS